MIKVILTGRVNTVPFTEHHCCTSSIMKEGRWGRSTTRSKHESPFSWLCNWSMSIYPLWKYHKQALYLCNDGKTTFQTPELAFYFSFFLLVFLCSAYIHYQIPSFEPIGTFKVCVKQKYIFVMSLSHHRNMCHWPLSQIWKIKKIAKYIKLGLKIMEKQALLWNAGGVSVRGAGATPTQGGAPPPCTVQGRNLQ